MPEVAVLVDRATKYYGQPDKPDYKPVLSHLSMTVETGHIYGLLGASGCGKTTLLSCIVGRRKLNSGEIWVLGGKPGTKGSGVPGPRVGYMPQEVALVGELTIRDALYYFGRIYGMSTQKINERFDFLTNLLELGSGGKQVKCLSGGQQRRVSLAAALVHEPELLILDEPCVGLDPVLRERIWNFLMEVARGGATVIITTHYIEETKQANKIGLLRDGVLLAEMSPEEILSKYNCSTLEEAFFKLALRQTEMGPRSRGLTASPDLIPESTVPLPRDSQFSSREDFSVVTSSTDILTKKEYPKKDGLTKSRYKAVFIKNLQQFARHPGGLIFSIIFPILQVVAFFSAVGHDPRDLHIGVVNDEAGYSRWGMGVCNDSHFTRQVRTEDELCELDMLSCWFLDEMEKHNLYQTPYNTTTEAIEQIKIGKLYGVLHFPMNFSEALAVKVRNSQAQDYILDASTVSVWLDTTNHQISNFIKSQLHKSYETFTRRYMRMCNRPENMIQIPVSFQEPVYGSNDAQFVGFMAPGIMITINFFLAAVITSTLMQSDRLEGTWERSAVAGVKEHEMLNVHIVIQTFVIVGQTLELMIIGFLCYGLPSKGSLATAGTLLFLQGFSGMCYGFLLSVFCSSFTLAFFIATGSFYPMILLCGILWPLEGMSKFLRTIALGLPFTIPTRSLRDIMEKGATVEDPEVYQGILVTVVWILVTVGLCFLRLRLKS